MVDHKEVAVIVVAVAVVAVTVAVAAAAVVDTVVAVETEDLPAGQETDAINFSCKIYSQIIASNY